jgi:hypothetical protein
VIRIVPSPVLGATVVIEQDPLKTFEVTIKHLFEVDLSLLLIDIKLEFCFIVISLSLRSIILISLNKILHKVEILVHQVVRLLFDELHLG